METKECANGKIRYEFGQKIHEVVFLEEIESKKDRRAKFLCFCGNEFEAWIHSVKSNVTKSCGCFRRKIMKDRQTTHGLSRHSLYNTYGNMIERCYTPTNVSYQDYGGSGVVVCDEWRNSFESFYNWAISNGWSEGLQIDKDIKGDGKLYSPETCIFVTPKQNSNNRRTSKFIEINGVRKTVAEWSSHSGISQGTLFARMKNGWSAEKSIFTPVLKKSKKCHLKIK